MLKVKSGDLNKMSLLFERHHRPLYGFLFHSTGQKESSEDMVQNVFYRMLKYRHTFKGEGEFKTWMYHLARNVLNDYVKKNKPFVHKNDWVEYAEKLPVSESADTTIQKEEEISMLNKAISNLSHESREVLILSRFQELKYEEIGRILEISEGAVKVRVHRAMNQLKNSLLVTR